MNGRATSEPRPWRGIVTRDDSGATAVTVVLLLVVFLGCAALVIDIGSLYVERSKVQMTVDSAALAGAQELPDTTAARQTATHYRDINAPEATALTIQFYSGSTLVAQSPAPDLRQALAGDGAIIPACYTVPLQDNGIPNTIRVTAQNPNAPLQFGQVWGLSSSQIGATALARVMSYTLMWPLPIGLVAKDDNSPTFGFVANETEDMSSDLAPGHMGWVSELNPPIANPGASNRWTTTALSNCINANGADWDVYAATYPVQSGDNSTVMGTLGSWYSYGKTAILPVLSNAVTSSSVSARIIGFVRVHFNVKPVTGHIKVVFERVIDKSEMRISHFWADSCMQKVELID